MSFARYIAGDVLLFLFCAITLPLWLPSWLWFSFRSWLDLQRFYWRCEETMRKNAERNAGVRGMDAQTFGAKTPMNSSHPDGVE